MTAQLQVPGGAHPQVLERREGGRRERLQDAHKDSLEHQEAAAGVDSLKRLFHGSWEGMRGARSAASLERFEQTPSKP